MAPAARAVLIASRDHRRRALARAGLPGPQPDPGHHRRGVLGADRGRQRRQALAQHLLPGDLGVAEAGALLGVAVHRAQQRVDVDERLLLDPGQQTRCARPGRPDAPAATEASCRAWPWVNSRRNCPNVAGAYTPPNSRGIPPERITSRSSMLSAPAAIPAMIEVSLPAGFTPAEATRVEAEPRPGSAISPDSPACSASAITGDQPRARHQIARHRTAAWPWTTHEVVSLSVPSWVRDDQDVDTPDSSGPEGTSTSAPPPQHRSPALHGSRLSGAATDEQVARAMAELEGSRCTWF